MRIISSVYICIIWLLTGLYNKGLIYIDVPIADDDYIVGKQNAIKYTLVEYDPLVKVA